MTTPSIGAIRARSALAAWTVAAALHAAPARADDAPEVAVRSEPGGVAVVTASLDIPAPPRAIWDIMLDCAAAPAFVPGLDRCLVLERAPDGAWDVREHRVSWARLLPPSRNVFRSHYVTGRSIRFERVEGPFDVMEGEWTLEPLDEGRATRVGYRARVGVPWPASGPLVRRAARRNTPEILTALRAEAVARAAAAPP